jgi:hypothetical protein
VLLVGPWNCFQGVSRRTTITNPDDLRRTLYPYLGDEASRGALARMYSRIMCTQSVAWQNSAEGVANHIGAMAQGGAIAAIVLPDLSGESDPRVSAVASTEMQQRAGPVSQWPLSARFAYVLENAPSHMSSAAAQEFRKLLSPEAIGTMVAVLVVWAASHAVGVGVAIDAVLVAVGFALAGWAIFDALGSLYDFIMLTKNAERIDDLDRAARALADGVAHLGVGVVVALLTRGAGRLTRGSAEATPRRLSTREDVPSRGQGGGGPPNPRRGTLSDQEAREWYLRQEADIPARLDRTQPIESQQCAGCRSQQTMTRTGLWVRQWCLLKNPARLKQTSSRSRTMRDLHRSLLFWCRSKAPRFSRALMVPSRAFGSLCWRASSSR